MNLTSLKFTNRDLLLIIDVQNDFVSGVLGTKRAQALIPDIAQFIRDFPGKKIFTMDTHQENYLSTQEGRNLPIIHTVEGTHGWELIDEIKALVTDEDIVFRKKAFGSWTWHANSSITAVTTTTSTSSALTPSTASCPTLSSSRLRPRKSPFM